MAIITTRAGKGSPLTHSEVDANFVNINAELGTKVGADSPTFTGIPAAPTAAQNTNTTQVATTAFVLGQANSTAGTVAMNGTQAAGTSNLYARADHVHPSDTTRAPLASPTFTGTPAAPTAAVGTSTTQLATTAFVNAEIANDAAPLAHVGSTGAAHGAATTSVNGFMSSTDKTKLDGIAAGAAALGSVTPSANGTASAGVATTAARSDHVHPTDTTRAPIDNPVLTSVVYRQQSAQISKSAAATLTAAELLNGIIQYTGAAATLTLPTGTTIEGGVVTGLAVDRSFDFSVINTGTGAATIGTATGLTLVGSMSVTNGTSGLFRVRKTATNTYTVYRMS